MFGPYTQICFEEFRGPLRKLKQVTSRPRAASLTCLGWLLARTFGLLGSLDLKRISGLADIIN